MALHHFPRIVTDGLVLCLDAGNPLSYPVGPELWDGTVSPTILNLGGTTGYYDIATKTMHSPTSAVYVDRPRFTFNLGLTAGKLYSIVGMLSGDLDDLTTGGRVNPNITLNTATGEINTTFTAVNESIWFVFNGNFSPSSVTIESLSVREVTSVWKDLSGNGNNGSLSAGVSYDNRSLLFGGTSTSPAASDSVNTIYTNNKFTYSLWFKYSTYTFYQGIGGINKNGSTTSMVFCYRIQGAGYIVFFDGFFGNVRRIMTIIPNTDIESYLNTFINLTTTYDNSILIGYLNGVEVVRQTYSAQIDDFREKGLILGADGGYGSAVNANIAQCLLYNTNLNANQVLDNYNATKGRYGL